MPDADTVQLSRRDERTAIVTLNRPRVLNAMNSDLIESLYAVLGEISADPALRVVVLTGAGRGFCSGADLGGYGGEHDFDPQDSRKDIWASLAVQQRIAGLVPALRGLPQPVIAAINGPAAGGGLGLALACDIRIAAPTAAFAVSFVRVGLSGCDIGVSWLLPRHIGASRSWELMLTGRTIDAREADRLGIVSRVEDDVMSAALTLADEISANTHWGVRMTKEVCWAQLEIASLQAGIDLENRTQMLSSRSGGEHAELAQRFVRRGGHPDPWRQS